MNKMNNMKSTIIAIGRPIDVQLRLQMTVELHWDIWTPLGQRLYQQLNWDTRPVLEEKLKDE